MEVARPDLDKSRVSRPATPVQEPGAEGVRASPASGIGRTATLMRLQRLVGNQATALLIQRWKDYNGKFIMGARPDTKTNKEWEGWVEYEDDKKNIFWGPPGHKSLAELRSAMSKAKQDATPPKPEKDYDAIFLKDPATIRFSQDSIDYTFKDGGNIEGLASGLKAGTTKAGEVTPILILERKGYLITLDNRRLWAFKKAGVQVRCQWATPDKIKTDAFKFTAGKNGKATITVRNAPSSFKG